MNHSLRHLTCALAILAGSVLVTSTNAQDQHAEHAPQTPLAENLFYNYYTQGGMNQVNAQMYLAPRPVPAYVGHSYYTYQPLLPHEHMYSHVRNYYKWTPGAYYTSPCQGQCGGTCGQCQGGCNQGGHLNKTTVVYSSSKNFFGPLAGNLTPALRLQSRYANWAYCPQTAKRALQPIGGRFRNRAGGGGCASGNCGGATSGGCAGGCAQTPVRSSLK